MTHNNLYKTPIMEEEDPLNEGPETTIAEKPPEVMAEPAEVKAPEKPAPSEQKGASPKYYSPYKEVDDSCFGDQDITQFLPNTLISDEELEHCYRLCEAQIKSAAGDKEKTRSLADIVDAFYQIAENTYGADFQSFFKRNVGRLTQYVVGEKGHKVRMAYPELRVEDSADILSGKIAVRYLNKVTRTGTDVQVPLWNSGIVVVLEPFSDQDMLDLNLALIKNQLEMGRNTRGASFTGDDIHVVGIITEFILQHVINSNVADRTGLSKLILASDIPSLMTGALSAIYPEGYPIIHPCSNDKCDYTITSVRKENGDFNPDTLLEFNKLIWIDKSYLDDEDVIHMSADKKYSDADIKRYQYRVIGKSGKDFSKAVVWHKSTSKGDIKISVSYKVPTIAEYSMMSNSWVQSVNKMAEDALLSTGIGNSANKEDAKVRYLNSYSAITDLVKHLCWIDYITIEEPDTESKTINDAKTIRSFLERFIKIDGLKEEFEKSIQAYKENTLISWTGIPNFECPKCGNGQTDPQALHPTLIPINMAGFFFTILNQRAILRYQLG